VSQFPDRGLGGAQADVRLSQPFPSGPGSGMQGFRWCALGEHRWILVRYGGAQVSDRAAADHGADGAEGGDVSAGQCSDASESAVDSAPRIMRFLAVSSGFGDQVGVVAVWRVDEGVVVSLAA
jgi:hypothetical protein